MKSSVHRHPVQHFYLSELVDRTEAKQYLERLCADLSRMLGLIVNELVTNAAKHVGGTSLAVSDEGDGVPDGFEPQTGCRWPRARAAGARDSPWSSAKPESARCRSNALHKSDHSGAIPTVRCSTFPAASAAIACIWPPNAFFMEACKCFPGRANARAFIS